MVEEGLLSVEKAQELLPEADRAELAGVKPGSARGAAPATAQPPTEADDGTIRVPYVPEIVKDEIREKIKQDVLAQAKSERWGDPGTLPEWMNRLTWEGDFRLRYQGDYYSSGNTDAVTYNAIEGTTLNNTRVDQSLWRLRLRLGLVAKVNERLDVGVRIATGSTSNPVSTNQTMGNTGQPYSFNLDRAYLKWTPSPQWRVLAGRMANPWFWPTDLVWDEDLAFEGAAGTYRPRFNAVTTGFVTAGVFPLQSASPTTLTPDPQTKWLYGLQAGTTWEPLRDVSWRVGAGLFDFARVEGERNTTGSNANDWTAPQFRQKGNTVFDINFGLPGSTPLLALAPKYRILNLGSEVTLNRSERMTVALGADYVRNIGFDQGEIKARTGVDVSGETSGYQAKLTVGQAAVRALNDWQVFIGYRYLERDAVLDAFTDSDFHLGGTNAKGYFIGAYYGLDKNAYLRARWLSANEISGPPLSIDVLQADFNVKF
ncbi:MAG: outer membrane receptor for ferric coprogen and ferric-rhodotorulic acid [Betaproteobacteria bacterium]|nr:outer membrane receptor for ferric coprogen and ferric-rhodotorulic acid [Betaproteobacteria bacterium]